MPKGILESILSGQGVIVPHVQPMYRLNDNRLMAREYLARLMDADGKAHPVGPILQDPDLRPEDRLILDLKFLESTFQTLTRSGDDTYLHFVNLEPVSLEAPGFWKCLPRWMEALPFGPEFVVMEFTESQGVHDPESLRGYANRLRDLGLRVAVDDLGAGVALLLPTLGVRGTQVYGLSPRDPGTLAMASALLLVGGAIAGPIHGLWRATHLRPGVARIAHRPANRVASRLGRSARHDLPGSPRAGVTDVDVRGIFSEGD